MKVYKAKASEVGRCSFCTRQWLVSVWVVTSEHGHTVRFCEDCAKFMRTKVLKI